MAGEQRKKLGDLLLEAGYIDQKQLEKALQMQRTEGKRLAELLLSEGMITEDNMLSALETQLGMPVVDLRRITIEPEAVNLISEQLARRYTIMPVERKNNTLVCATNDPLNFLALDDIKNASNCDISLVLDKKQRILDEIEKSYGRKKAEKAIADFATQAAVVEAETDFLADSAEIANSPVVRLVESMIRNAVALRTSDIHIEPQEHYLRIRFRIDGVLTEVLRPPKSAHAAMVTRVKLLSGMEISEKRLPQDGRYETVIEGVPVDMRVSSLPTVYGEKIVIRILERNNFNMTKEQLGFDGPSLELFDSIIKNPNGILLISGPTGSGKTTTLYAVMHELNDIGKNIITVEDPVEYRLDGINQVQVNVKAGLGFADGLRSILRQDPDIIMIGEMRDTETAQIAVRSAITGHLVLSTIHTNDSPSTISRLVDMGIEPFFVATAVVGICSQRLVRRICESCREEYEADEYEKRLLGVQTNERVSLFRGTGCGICSQTGYKGRTAIHEVMPISRNIRALILNGGGVDEIRDEAKLLGMTTLNRNAANLARQGITTIDELARVAYNMEV